MVARIGGIAAPYIALYLPTIDWTFAKKLPMLIMGISSILGGLLAFCLPETLGSSLPEKMDDVKEMKKNAKPLCSCVNPKTLPWAGQSISIYYLFIHLFTDYILFIIDT